MYRRHANYWLSTASSGGPRYGTHVLYNNHELAEPSSRPSRLSNLARFCPAGGSHLNQWANITTAETGFVCTCVRACVRACVCLRMYRFFVSLRRGNQGWPGDESRFKATLAKAFVARFGRSRTVYG